MDANLSVNASIAVLTTLICCSAFFSGSETGMMAINRYRLKHLARTHRRAAKIQTMLMRPDRLLGVILIGNTFANILASAIATLVAVRLYGESIGVPVATVGLTMVLLIFGEVTPKTLAALYPERFSFVTVYPLSLLSKLLYPLVWLVNGISNNFLRLFGFHIGHAASHSLSREELRTIVHESAGRHRLPRSMLLRVLDLETVTVDDIMVPRAEVTGINLDDDWDDILDCLSHCQHTLLPVFRGELNAIEGILHVRHIINVLSSEEQAFDEKALLSCLETPYFVPDGTPLQQQLVEFQQNKQRMALVVDEYGDVQGLIALEDILEEIVGEFTTDMAANRQEIHPQEDGTYLVDGTLTVRELNRQMRWGFPMDGPKTLSGLITEQLESIPEPGTCLLINKMPIEVVQVKDNCVKTLRITPRIIEQEEQAGE